LYIAPPWTELFGVKGGIDEMDKSASALDGLLDTRFSNSDEIAVSFSAPFIQM
jgi:hypothetical protein